MYGGGCWDFLNMNDSMTFFVMLGGKNFLVFSLNPSYFRRGADYPPPMVFAFFSNFVSASYEKTSLKFSFHIFEDFCILIWSKRCVLRAILGEDRDF